MTSSPETPDRKPAAYHEAGHAIVGQALGGSVQYAEIMEDGRGFTKILGLDSEHTGFVNPKDIPPANVDSWMKLLTQQVAGYVAEEMAMGEVDPEPERGQVLEMLMLPLAGVRERRLSCGEAEVELQRLERRARAILTQNRSVLNELAAALQHAMRMEGEGLDRFLRRVEAS